VSGDTPGARINSSGSGSGGHYQQHAPVMARQPTQLTQFSDIYAATG